MSKHFNSKEDAVILGCVEKTRQNGDHLAKGFQNAAQSLKKTHGAVARRYYRIMSEEAEKTGRNRRSTAFSEKDDAAILECVAEACNTGCSVAKGLRAAAQKLNKSYDSVSSRYRRIKNSKQTTPSIREALQEMTQKGEIPPADKEKLTRVAQLTGKHYHTVLSTFGGLTACGALASKGACDWKCAWHKAATVSSMYDDGMTLKQVAAWSGMSKEDIEEHVKAYKEGKSAQFNAEKENVLLKAQIKQKDVEIAALNSDLKTRVQETEQYRIILDALAQQLGIENWDKEPTVYFANEIYNKLVKLVSGYHTAHKLSLSLLKRITRKSAGFEFTQARYGGRQEAQLH